jgi:plasmid stability protein
VGTLNIRNLPDEVQAALRVRAAKAGRSMEAEARAILTEACLPAKPKATARSLMDWVDALYQGRKPEHVVDELIAERRREAETE